MTSHVLIFMKVSCLIYCIKLSRVPLRTISLHGYVTIFYMYMEMLEGRKYWMRLTNGRTYIESELWEMTWESSQNCNDSTIPWSLLHPSCSPVQAMDRGRLKSFNESWSITKIYPCVILEVFNATADIQG